MRPLGNMFPRVAFLSVHGNAELRCEFSSLLMKQHELRHAREAGSEERGGIT